MMKVLNSIIIVIAIFMGCTSPSSNNSNPPTEQEINQVNEIEAAVEKDLKETEQINKELDSLLNTL